MLKNIRKRYPKFEKRTLFSDVLRNYYRGIGNSSDKLIQLDLNQVRLLITLGLGPMAYSVYSPTSSDQTSGTLSELTSANLTARIAYAQMDRATIATLEALRSTGIIPVLFKGIALSKDIYSPSYFRLMGDVDILVQDDEADRTMQVLSGLGYVTEKDDWIRFAKQKHHHLPAARHKDTGVTIEIHTRLLSPRLAISRLPVFRPSTFRDQILDSNYSGAPARRFTPEYQLILAVAKWTVDDNWAYSLTGINDFIHLHNQYGEQLNWQQLEDWIYNSRQLFLSLLTLTNYLDQSGIIDPHPALIRMLGQSRFDNSNVLQGFLMLLMHRYPFNSREMNIDPYTAARAAHLWRGLTASSGTTISIPVAVVRTILRHVHHGALNPLNWLLRLYRFSTSRFRH